MEKYSDAFLYLANWGIHELMLRLPRSVLPLETARELGFRSMQFNFVTSCNPSAIDLWKRLGFEIVGTLPGAFRLADGELIDAYVMARAL